MHGRLLVMLLALAMTACGGGGEEATDGATGMASPTPTEEECHDATGEDQAVVVMGDNFFDPTCIQVSTEQGLALRNDGAALHSFTVENVDLDLDVQAGEETNTEALGGAIEVGTYKFICKYHAQMIGELRVV